MDPKRRAGGATEGYGVKADCYSLGACIYVMLSGIFPSLRDARRNQSSKFWTRKPLERHSSDAKDLIANLMDPHPVNRPTSAEALKHPWFTNDLAASRATLDPQTTATIIKSPTP